MSCQYCVYQVDFETKPNFPYSTRIVENSLVVSKRLEEPGEFGDYRDPIYGNTIKYCPMCGEKIPDRVYNRLSTANCTGILETIMREKYGDEVWEDRVRRMEEIKI